MANAFEWLNKLVDWFAQFFPRWVIFDPREAGVKFVRGKPKLMAAGQVHFYWPATTTIDQYPTVRQSDNLASQTIESKDGVTFTVGGVLIYDVPDVLKLLTTCHSAVKLVSDIALSGIHDVCCKMTWEELKEEQRRSTLDTKLKNSMKKDLEDYGIRLHKCMLTDLAKTRVLKVHQAIQKDE
jgi:regulator of protease activity HflC (stomatin/prohibitin superfamily)